MNGWHYFNKLIDKKVNVLYNIHRFVNYGIK